MGGIGFDFSMGYLQNQYSEIQSAKDTHYYINGWTVSDEMIDHDKTLYLNSFTKDEREFLSHISDKYEWIAKDGDNDKEVWVYKVFQIEMLVGFGTPHQRKYISCEKMFFLLVLINLEQISL